MANTTTSPYMSLPIPTVGVDYGPDWANNLNACLTTIDSHNHATGYGAQITPSGLNINADLTFSTNNATQLRTTRFSAQSTPLSTSSSSDVGCVYVAGVDLYYNDTLGNQVRLTSGGGVAGSPGSITNLTSPASAAYVSANQTFVWQSAANTSANMDGASVLLRNLTANSKALTLSPPSGMGSDYTITLPAVAGSTKLIQMDSSGNMSTADADGVTLQFSSSTLSVRTSGINSSQLASAAVQIANVNKASVIPTFQSQTYTSAGSASFVVSSGMTMMLVELAGGGAGGGGGAGYNAGSNGGGGAGGNGSAPFIVTFAVTAGETLTVSVGAGGTGGGGGGSSTDGSAGGGGSRSWLKRSGTLIAQSGGANPGNGGVSITGTGGTSAGGGFFGLSLQVAGGDGGAAPSGSGTAGNDAVKGNGGAGGSSASAGNGGGGGASNGDGGAGASGNGQAGSAGGGNGAGGGGGSGGDHAFSAAGGAGGAGAAGYVRLVWGAFT